MWIFLTFNPEMEKPLVLVQVTLAGGLPAPGAGLQGNTFRAVFGSGPSDERESTG